MLISRQRQCWAACVIVCGAALFYLSQWLKMPLYPDEIAFRLLRARYLADGAMAYGLLPCLSNAREIPVIFRPVAYALSVIDSGAGWSMVRYPQVVGVMLALLTTLLVTIRRDAIAAALMTAAALIGVVGSGVILSRGEAPLFFLGVACVAGYGVVIRRHPSPLISGTYLVVTTCLALMAVFVHQQALILLPILLLLVLAIALRTPSLAMRGLAGLCAVAMLVGATASLATAKVNCPEFPSIAPVFAKMELTGLARQEGWPGVETYLLNKLPRYAGIFGFNTKYDINYLPGFDPAGSGGALAVLNAGIVSAVLLNLLLAFVVMIVLGVGSLRLALGSVGSRHERLAGLLREPSLYLCLGIAGHLALLIYDVPTAFYRCFYVHFMLVMLNTMALSGIRGKGRLFLWPLGVASLVLCVASGFLSQEIDRKFAGGWAGPSIRLQTDWKAARMRIGEAAGRCNIGIKDTGIVIDDRTFDGMKQYPHLIPFTYLGFAVPPNEADAASLNRVLRRVSASAIVTSCQLMKGWGFVPEFEKDGICCLKLPAAG
ncbi:hypothetical protein [Tardiphaga sp.]|uniref:hypothetical protein n=1 Tax=Tardiphaga sp. TaxID=1926292 RepID=UPI002634E03B|nr:hypothetical protein [Tardiphaga sp.]MDB5619753.1 hypothetical protein [Tardiphaga sp.]